jgi:hypothetical protein
MHSKGIFPLTVTFMGYKLLSTATIFLFLKGKITLLTMKICLLFPQYVSI